MYISYCTKICVLPHSWRNKVIYMSIWTKILLYFLPLFVVQVCHTSVSLGMLLIHLQCFHFHHAQCDVCSWFYTMWRVLMMLHSMTCAHDVAQCDVCSWCCTVWYEFMMLHNVTRAHDVVQCDVCLCSHQCWAGFLGLQRNPCSRKPCGALQQTTVKHLKQWALFKLAQRETQSKWNQSPCYICYIFTFLNMIIDVCLGELES